MPAYRSAGIKASLKLGDDDLLEKPIGEDGSSSGVIRFIGASNDLPCFMVEAAQDQRSWVSTPPSNASRTGSSLPSSPLTNFSTPRSSENRKDSLLLPSAQSPLLSPHQPAQPLGFSAEFNASLWATISQVEEQRRRAKQVLLEIFVNGNLVEAASLHPFDFDDQSLYTWEVRNQWLYQHSESLSKGSYNAEERWAAVADSLRNKAADLSTRRAGKRPFSIDYLEALSTIPLPEKLQEKHTVGIMDVVITAVGDLFGQAISQFKQEPAVPRQNPPATQADTDLVDSSSLSPQKLTKLAQHNEPSTVQERSPKKRTPSKKTMALAKAHSLEDRLHHTIENFRNRRGQIGPKRTVYNRIIDIQKMKAKSRRAALLDLKRQLAEQDRQRGPDRDDAEEPHDSVAVASAQFCNGSSLSFSSLEWAASRGKYVECEEFHFIVGIRFVVL